jgi:hypothetical protein
MKSKKSLIDIPPLREYIYTVFYNATTRVKNAIPPRFLKYVRSHREAKKFIDNSNLDEKIVLLSMLGIRWFLVFVDDKTTSLHDLRQLLSKFKEDKKLLALKEIIELQLFVTSDKELIYLLGLMSQVIDTAPYKTYSELSRSGYSKLPQQLVKGSTTDEADIFFIQSTLNSPLVLKRSEILFDLSELQMLILLFLYPRKHAYVLASNVELFFDGRYNPRQVSGALRDLLRTDHIQKDIGKDYKVTITALGITKVNRFKEAVIKSGTFM